MNWQPIETAPKDGTQILLCQENWGPWVGWWGTHDGGRDDWWFLDPSVDSRDKLNCWLLTSGPTHWMPLPEPPK